MADLGKTKINLLGLATLNVIKCISPVPGIVSADVKLRASWQFGGKKV